MGFPFPIPVRSIEEIAGKRKASASARGQGARDYQLVYGLYWFGVNVTGLVDDYAG